MSNTVIDTLAQKLAPYYSHFDVGNRLLFTGHSHQAWPDVALDGLRKSFGTAATEVDKKWEQAFGKTEILREYLREFYDDPRGYYCLAENTHLLLVSWLSSFDLKRKPKIITTDGEFHSMYRQLKRLEEEGLEVVRLNAESDDLPEKVREMADAQTAAIMMSRIYFQSGIVNTHISKIAEIARSNGIPFLVDDYHGTNVVRLSLREENLEDCYFLIGGYKYLQWGEGNCFLRFPHDCTLRPAVTGWFASFRTLDEPRNGGKVQYDDGNQRFATGTYDPASQFRAAEVVRFFREHEIGPGKLEKQYNAQVALLREKFMELNLDPEIIRPCHNRPPEETGGFFALRSSHARTIRARLLEREVFTDARGSVLRLGPAPYITSEQIERCIEELGTVVRDIEST